MIEFLNLEDVNSPVTPMGKVITEAVERVRRSGRYVLGPEVEAFEAEWAAYCGVKHCVGTGNALDALRLILMASDIGPGAEIIVPANTYIATWLSVTLAGCVPVPVDADEDTMNIDPAKVEAAITPQTVAIMATHLYGRAANMNALAALAKQHKLALFADAAQAHGAMYWGKRAGSLCDAEAFTFYPSKNLGAMGDAGCVTTNDGALAARIRRLRNYGGVGRLDHTVRGINSRLDEMQAAILRAKLPYLDAMNKDRETRAFQYEASLLGAGQILAPYAADWTAQHHSCWHQYVIRSKDRDGLRERLRERGVDAHIHYPVPPYLEPAYADMGIQAGAFPVTEMLAKEILSLPIGWSFPQAAVIDAVLECAECAEPAVHA